MTSNSRSRPLPSLPSSSNSLELNDLNPYETLLDERVYSHISNYNGVPLPAPTPVPVTVPKDPKCFSSCSSKIAIVLLVILIVLLVYYGSGGFVTAIGTTTPTANSTTPTTGSTPKCDPGYEYFEETDHCYKVSLSGAKFAKAKASCESERAHLASIHSKAENNFLNYLYNNKLTNYNKDAERKETRRSVWLGLVFLDGKWIWTDGSPLDYDYWGGGEPNLLYERNIHAEMEVNQFVNWSVYAGLWIAVPASNFLAYFCKKPSKQLELKRKLEFTTITVPDVKPEVKKSSKQLELKRKVESNVKPEVCSPGYKFLPETNYCYKVFISKSTFDQADRICKSDQANLASIHSRTENRLLADMARRNSETFPLISRDRRLEEQEEVIIGLRHTNDTWKWTDGTDVNFVNWADEPRDRLEPDREMRTALVTSKIAEWNPDGNFWNDIRPNSTQGAFICKKAKLVR